MENLLRGTKTELALMNAFAGESQARNRYTYFASIAEKEGYEQISAIFLETADNEKEHAEVFYKLLGNCNAKVNAVYPIELGTTIDNLRSAAAGEHEEWEHLYKESAEIAKEEGFREIAEAFLNVLEVEKIHEARYNKLISNIKHNEVFKKPNEVDWKCRNCGRHLISFEAPQICPTCKHPQAYFEVASKNY